MKRALAVLLLLAAATTWAHQDTAVRPSPFDEVLDVYVRDGLVYYRALKLERGKFDRVVGELATASIDKLSREGQIAFWLNAYNALVLRTVIDRYPIDGKSPLYPANSVRQIPGAFEGVKHRVAGQVLTLDEIETRVLGAFHDPRIYFALGRGAVDSGRLRSEAFTAERVESQLAEVASECTRRLQCVQIDRGKNHVMANAIFSWRNTEFTAVYAGKAAAAFAGRSPVERAILAYIQPGLFSLEQAFLARDAFDVSFMPFDWSLNDLTGRGGQ